MTFSFASAMPIFWSSGTFAYCFSSIPDVIEPTVELTVELTDELTDLVASSSDAHPDKKERHNKQVNSLIKLFMLSLLNFFIGGFIYASTAIIKKHDLPRNCLFEKEV
jgi:hypothetical protein